MVGQLLDIRKIIAISILVAAATSVFLLINIYALIGVLLAVFSSMIYGARNVIVVFTISTYLLVTSDLNEGLRNALNLLNLICLILVFIYYEGISFDKLEAIPSGLKLLLGVTLASFILSSLLSDYFVISLATLIRQTLFLTICFIYYTFIKTKNDSYLLVFTLIFIAFVLGGGIIYQLLSEGLGVFYLSSIDVVRYSGLYNNPNAVGLFFTVSIPLLFSFIFNTKVINSGSRKNLIMIAFVLLLVCLMITNSRASIFSVFVSIAYILFVFKRKAMIKVLALAMAFILIILIIPIVQEYFLFYIRAERIFSNTRTYFWSVAFDIIKANPVFGVGPGVFEQYIYKYLPVNLGGFFEHQMNMASSGTAHNFFLFRMADLGIPGLITSIWLFVLYFRYSNASIKYFNGKDKELHIFSVAIKSIGLGLLVRAFLESTGLMTHGWITRDLPFWIMFIILISIYQKIPKDLVTGKSK